MPGPGTYQPELSMKGYEKKRGYSMAQKYDLLPRAQVPGPGTYSRRDFVEVMRPKTAAEEK